jgi:hypothetical protein
MTDIIIGRDSGGINPIGRDQSLPQFYAAGAVRPAGVEVWWRYQGEPAAAARLIGTYSPGQRVSFPYTPIGDKNLVLSTISLSAAGVRSVRDIRDAPEFLVVFQRETGAPTVTQVGTATHTLITLAIDGFSAMAYKRKIRTADNAGMTTNLSEEVIEVAPGVTLPRLVYLNRPTPGAGARTIYVRVSHSSGGAYGAESAAAAFTWADSGGSGGGSGSGDPYGGGGATCFSGNVRIQTPAGYKSFDELRAVCEKLSSGPGWPAGQQPRFAIENETGEHLAELVVHDYNGRMIDMGGGELVTFDHAMKAGHVWISAAERFPKPVVFDAERGQPIGYPEYPRVHFAGLVFNLHILSDFEEDRHYCLENGEVAHNVKPIG